MNLQPAKSREAQADARFYYAIARAVALLAGVISLTVILMLVINHVRYISADPINSEALLQLIEAHNKNPGDAALQADIRTLDLLARKALFASLDFGRWGSYMLLIGLALWIAALKSMTVLSAKLPDPTQFGEVDRLSRKALSRWLVSVTGALVVAIVFALVVTFRSALPPEAAVAESANGEVLTPEEGIDFPEWTEVAANWANFRGPSTMGTGHSGSAPTSWDVEAGTGIKWKIKLPKPGFSSPVLWGEQLFITGGDAETRELYCIDSKSGAITWSREVRNPTGQAAPKVSADTGFAPMTPCTDGKRVFAMYPTGDLACFDLAGELIWQRNFGTPDNDLGHAASPIIWQDLLLIQLDQNEGAGQLHTLKAATGKTVWTREREVHVSWSTPAVAKIGDRDAVFISGLPLVSAYDLRSGDELWSVDCMKGEIAPSPTVAGGLAFFVTEHAKLSAIDLTTGTIKWQAEDDLPDVCSPAATDEFLFMANNSGMISCHAVATGEVLWKKELYEGFYASPVIVNKLVYLFDLYGDVQIFKAAASYEPLPKQNMGEEVYCTPAVANGCLYVRGKQQLFCIGATDD